MAVRVRRSPLREARSRMVEKSQTSGERKLIHSEPRVLGYGNIQCASHGRPMWISGNNPAHITAKMVMASAERFTEVRHFCRKRKRIAEINVPAWPMPIQKTKLVMSNAQPNVRFKPQVPIPVRISYAIAAKPVTMTVKDTRNAAHHAALGRFSMAEKTSFDTSVSDLLPRIHGRCGAEVTSAIIHSLALLAVSHDLEVRHRRTDS